MSRSHRWSLDEHRVPQAVLASRPHRGVHRDHVLDHDAVGVPEASHRVVAAQFRAWVSNEERTSERQTIEYQLLAVFAMDVKGEVIAGHPRDRNREEGWGALPE